MEGDPLIHKNANESLSWCQNLLFFSEKRKKAKQNIKKQKEEDIFVNS